MPTYAMKSVSMRETSRGVSFVGTLHKNGKRIATVENDGSGAETCVYWDAVRDLRAEEERVFLSWYEAHRSGHWSEDFPPHLGLAVEMLLDWHDFDGMSKQRFLLRNPADSECIQTAEVPPELRNDVARGLAERYAAFEVWDSTSHRWNPVSTLVDAAV